MAGPVVSNTALFAIEYALARLWESWGVRPQMLAGYSLGEYVAACLAGVFSLEGALELLVKRAGLIDRVRDTAMLAVALGELDIIPWLGDELDLAATNGPLSCVVSGRADLIEGLARRLVRRDVAARRLRVPHALHSREMLALAGELTLCAAAIPCSRPRIPYISSLSGTWITEVEATDPGYWGRHLSQTVRFSEALHELWQQPGVVLLEVGPGTFLSSLAQQHPASRHAVEPLVLTSLPSGFGGVSDWPWILQTAGKLWLAGVDVEWGNVLRSMQGANALMASRAVGMERSLPARDTRLANCSPIAQRLAEFWQEVLALSKPPELGDDFFALGGHSLSALRLAVRIREAFQVELPLGRFFDHPTLGGMAEVIESRILEELGQRRGAPPPYRSAA
jgi:acyl transferase domain-containing protein